MKFILIVLFLCPVSFLYADDCPFINGVFESANGYEANFETRRTGNQVTEYVMSRSGRSPDRFRPDGKAADIDENNHSAGTFTAVCRNGNEVILDIQFLIPVKLEFKEIYKLNTDGSVDLTGVFTAPEDIVFTHFAPASVAKK